LLGTNLARWYFPFLMTCISTWIFGLDGQAF
jgi:hypothetical protein